MSRPQPRRRSFSSVLLIIQSLLHGSNAWMHSSPPNMQRLSLEKSLIYGRSKSGLASIGRVSKIIYASSIRSRLHSTPSETDIQSSASRIANHLADASQASTKKDITSQFTEMEMAERELLQCVEEYRRGNEIEKPKVEVFQEVIWGLLALPSIQSDNAAAADNLDEDDNQAMDQLRTVMNQGKRHKQNEVPESKSERATRILDLMESLYEPTGSIYDDVIAAHCKDALEHVQQSDEEEQSASAWKSVKSALALLNRSEELYRETGEDPTQLPSVSSYVAIMDVYRALAVNAEENSNDKKREEALNIVRALHSRRLEVYSFDKTGGRRADLDDGRYNLLPADVISSVKNVLQYTIDVIKEANPSYEAPFAMDSLGTWHFNQLIFDLAKYPQQFSGPLAQDLLEFMVATVQLESAKLKLQGGSKSDDNEPVVNPIVPKPNTDTINGVLKAWMVTPKINDAARRAEAVLAQIAVWQADGTLWGIHPDVCSYNTCIACWKESGIPGCAARATEILTLLEAKTTDIQPDDITYASCIGAWAESSSHDKRAGRRAEEILTRMYQRSKENDSRPAPNTRCFNAVLLAYANGREAGGGKRALDLLRFMEKLHSEGYPEVQPDSYTLNIVMKALVNCGEKGAAQKANDILKRMEESYSSGDGRLKPDLLSYNTVLDAFAKKGDAKSAEALLNEMYARAEKESKSVDVVRPDAYSYTSVLSAWMRNDDKAMAVRQAEELFNDLESKYAAGKTDVRANTQVYNALLNCWAKSGDRKALYRVTQILDLMEELGLQGGDSDVEPNSRTYAIVLDAYARSRNWKAYNESLAILDRMEQLYSEGYESLRPCARAYSIVISTIARSRKKGKAIKAQEILHRMESEYRRGNISARPTEHSYNAVLNAAAYTPRGDEREQEDAFKVACLTFDQLRMSDYLKPSHISYGTFLKAVLNHMPSSDVRDDLVKSVFRRCCRDGQVGTLVLRNMKQLASPELYESLLEGNPNNDGEFSYDLPKSWSVNVREPGVSISPKELSIVS